MISDVLSEAVNNLDRYLNNKTFDRVYSGELRERILKLRDQMDAVRKELDKPPAIADIISPVPARQGGLYMREPSSAPKLTGKSHEEMVEIMQDWFFTNFEDPAESTPYESAEGGYQYIWGGPYDANEELQSAFLDVPLTDPAFDSIENAIKEAVEEIQQHGWDWAPHSNRMDEER